MKQFLLFIFLFIVVGTAMAQTTFSEAQKTKKGKLICQFSETPGYITSVSGSSPVGVLPELMNAYAESLKKNQGIDVTLDYQPVKQNTPIKEIFDGVNNASDGVFGLIFVYITEARKKTYKLSAPVFESPTFLVTGNATPDLTNASEATTKLKGYTAFVNQGNFFEDKFKDLKSQLIPDLKIEYFKTYDNQNITQTLQAPNAMLYVDIGGLLHAMRSKVPFKNHKELQFSTPMGVLMSQKNTWADSFNQFLNSGFTKSTEFKKIIANNLGHHTFSLLNLK